MKGLEVNVAVVVCVGVEDNVPENLNKICFRKPEQKLFPKIRTKIVSENLNKNCFRKPEQKLFPKT